MGLSIIYEPRHVFSNNVALTQTSLCNLLLNLDTPTFVRSVAEKSLNIQATSKGSDQSARICRLVWAFAGRTYHIIGNLMSRLIL